jgi:hypothetical protein
MNDECCPNCGLSGFITILVNDSELVELCEACMWDISNVEPFDWEAFEAQRVFVDGCWRSKQLFDKITDVKCNHCGTILPLTDAKIILLKVGTEEDFVEVDAILCDNCNKNRLQFEESFGWNIFGYVVFPPDMLPYSDESANDELKESIKNYPKQYAAYLEDSSLKTIRWQSASLEPPAFRRWG